MKNLISLEQIVEQQLQIEQSSSEFKEAIKHSLKALKQPPQLNHFVPAIFKDGNWRVLEKINDEYPNNVEFFEEIEEYETALNDVLFNGFEVKRENIFESITNGKCTVFLKMVGKDYESNFKSYSDLTKYNLPLNEKGCEKFNL